MDFMKLRRSAEKLQYEKLLEAKYIPDRRDSRLSEMHFTAYMSLH